MKDKIIRGTAKDGQIKFVGGITTELVKEAVKKHETMPLASAALGRMLTAGALLSTTLKSEKEVLTIKIDGGGEAKGVVVTAKSNGRVKGLIGNPSGHMNANELGKLDVGGYIGKDGQFTYIKDLGLKDPYVGQVPIYTGEIAEDLAYYFTVSEQTPSAVALGVLADKDLIIKASGGFIIQMMPGADELLADFLTYRLEEIPTVTTLLSEGKDIEEILSMIFEDMDMKILEEIEPEYYCDCSREKVERALISVGKEQLKEIHDEGKDEELKCHFCNTSYKFTNDDIGNLLK